jgi:hypothetical protein
MAWIGEAGGVRVLGKIETKVPGRKDSGSAFLFPKTGIKPGAA